MSRTVAVRLLDWCLFHALPVDLRWRAERRDEQQASLQLYSTSGRSVVGLPRKRPGAVSAARGLTHEEITHECHALYDNA